jgi:hypothetical protein
MHHSASICGRLPRRVGVPAALAAAIVLAAGCAGSPARSSPAPASSSPASGGGYLYWTNDTSTGRARLDGTGVDQDFITGASGAA